MIPIIIALILMQGCVTNVVDKSYSSRQDIVQSILDDGAFFSQTGEHMAFYVPINKLFVPYTSQWKSNAQDRLLFAITDFINTYDVVEVNITSKLFGAKNKRLLNAIARQQANSVANLMDKYKLDVRVVNIMRGDNPENLPAKTKVIKNNKVLGNYGYITIDFRFNHKFF